MNYLNKRSKGLTMQINFHSLLWSYLPRVPIFLAMTVYTVYSRPARTAPSNPWLSDVLREHQTRLRVAERKWQKANDPSDLSMYQSLLSSFSAEVHTAKSSHFHKINSAPDMRNLFRTFNYLLCPPPPPPTTSITADDFATFFYRQN